MRDLVSSDAVVRDIDFGLKLLITEDSGDYFDGLITAEEAAKNIQSRVEIYLSERR